MATENTTTPAGIDLPLSNIPAGRIEAALHASYELEALAISFPRFVSEDVVDLTGEYQQRLYINRIKELAGVVMSALDDDRETSELRRIVGLEGANHD